jgi:hypothetical protein
VRRFTRLYYDLKPFLPARVRLGARRWAVAGTRRRHRAEWPIMEKAGIQPANWGGWPDGKRFALVLTHDVEGKRGLERCQNLARLEADVGFRSSFNFVPEGEYETPASLRESLKAKGFEVGVHDLNHDGKLYRSRAGFASRAQRINHYLRSWGAVGFRSGFMLHQLDWLHDLDALYDASTFDADPFEPQPDGVETIFPFWVPGREGRPGYVELPYTLAQDSTLFLFLRERSIDVWKRKLDWIVQRGGMALVNAHPDYMAFAPETATFLEYPSDLYRQLLEYACEKYGGHYWTALPREVAEFVRQRRGVGGSGAAPQFDSRTEAMATSVGSSRIDVPWSELPASANEANGAMRDVAGAAAFAASDSEWKKEAEMSSSGPLRGKRAAVVTF